MDKNKPETSFEFTLTQDEYSAALFEQSLRIQASVDALFTTLLTEIVEDNEKAIKIAKKYEEKVALFFSLYANGVRQRRSWADVIKEE